MKKSYLFILLFQFLSLSLLGQSEKLEMWQEKLITAQDSAKTDILLEIAKLYAPSSLENTRKYAQQALSEAQKLNYRNGIASAYSLLADSYRRTTHTVVEGDTLGALAQKYGVLRDNILKWNDLRTETLFIGQELLLFNVKTKEADYREAERLYREALKIRTESGNSEAQSWTLKQLGDFYTEQQNYPEAEKYLLQWADLRQKTGKHQDWMWLYLSDFYEKASNKSQSNAYFDRLIEAQTDKGLAGIKLKNRGLDFLRNKNFVRAEEYFLKAIEFLKKQNAPDELRGAESEYYVYLERIGREHKLPLADRERAYLQRVKMQKGIERTRAWEGLANFYIYSESDLKKGEQTYDSLIQWCRHEKDTSREIMAWESIASTWSWKKDFEKTYKALRNLDSLISKVRMSKKYTYSWDYMPYQIGKCLYGVKALPAIDQWLAQKDISVPALVHLCHLGRMVCQFELKDNAKALAYLLRALPSVKEKDKTEWLDNIAFLYQLNRNWRQAERYFLEATAIEEKAKNNRAAGLQWDKLRYLYEQEGNTKGQEKAFEKMLIYFEGNPGKMAETLARLAVFHFEQKKDYFKAVSLARKALDVNPKGKEMEVILADGTKNKVIAIDKKNYDALDLNYIRQILRKLILKNEIPEDKDFVIHTLSKGDNLSNVVRMYDVNFQCLQKWNYIPENEIDSVRIRVCKMADWKAIEKPKTEEKPIENTTDNLPKDPVNSSLLLEVIAQFGDSIVKLAQQYNTNALYLAQLNNMSVDQAFFGGEKINVPYRKDIQILPKNAVTVSNRCGCD
jgi:tetratricopeptide (TPR) repeat protein